MYIVLEDDKCPYLKFAGTQRVCLHPSNDLGMCQAYLADACPLHIKKFKEQIEFEELHDCHDCGAKPGEIHKDGCDTEQCSVCGNQRLQCSSTEECEEHDPFFARWTGLWPGKAESEIMGLDLNEFSIKYSKIFFVKPFGERKE